MNALQELVKIRDGAPDGATHHAQGMGYVAYNSSGNWMHYNPNGIKGFCWFEADNFKFSYVRSFRSLSDINNLIELIKERNKYQLGLEDISRIVTNPDLSAQAAQIRMIKELALDFLGDKKTYFFDELIDKNKQINQLMQENERLKQADLKNDLLVMSNARRLIKAKKRTSNGRLYMELFGTGMTTAYGRCRELGLEPDSNVTKY